MTFEGVFTIYVWDLCLFFHEGHLWSYGISKQSHPDHEQFLGSSARKAFSRRQGDLACQGGVKTSTYRTRPLVCRAGWLMRRHGVEAIAQIVSCSGCSSRRLTDGPSKVPVDPAESRNEHIFLIPVHPCKIPLLIIAGGQAP